jgi:hypothetical protein
MVDAKSTGKEIARRRHDPETERALKIAAKAAKKYRDALRTLSRGGSDRCFRAT